jgi:hypothetical protein
MNIRKGKPEDMHAVLGLIQELAFEKEPDAVLVTVDDLIRWFGPVPLFHVFVAEIENDPTDADKRMQL